jgi:hypothetical protein
MKYRLLIAFNFLLCLLMIFYIFSSKKSTLKPLIITTTPKIILISETHKNFNEWNEIMKEYLEFSLDNHYGSHTIVLLAALYICNSGPILELGMESNSTPLLHRLTKDQNRFLLSADSDRRWINYFSSLTSNSTHHQLKYVQVQSEMGIEWATSNLEEYRNWSIVFVDHRPGPRRQFDLMSYFHRSHLVI